MFFGADVCSSVNFSHRFCFNQLIHTLKAGETWLLTANPVDDLVFRCKRGIINTTVPRHTLQITSLAKDDRAYI